MAVNYRHINQYIEIQPVNEACNALQKIKGMEGWK